MRRINVWLDDVREPPEGYVWIRSVEDVIKLLDVKILVPTGSRYVFKSLVKELSLDNNLGSGFDEGKCVVDWLEKRVSEDNGFCLPDIIYVHTGNPVAGKYMMDVLNKISPDLGEFTGW